MNITPVTPRTPRPLHDRPGLCQRLTPAALAILLLPWTASAATLYWSPGANPDVGGGGTWTTAANWSTTPGSTKTPSGSAPTTSDDVVFGGTGGAVSLGGSTATFANTITVNAPNYSFVAAGTTTTRSLQFSSFNISLTNPADIASVVIQGGASAGTRGGSLVVDGNTTFAGTIQNGANLGFDVRKQGSGTLTLTGSNTQTGTLQIAAGGIQIGNGGATGSVTSSRIMSSTASVSLSLNRSNTVTLNSFIGSSSVAGERNINLIQSGPGTSILTADNHYTGTTSVNAGALLINGNQANSTGVLTVAAGATLGGSGTHGGATTIDGILAPGNSIGTLTINSDVTWNHNTGSDWAFELGTPGLSLGAPGASDRLAIDGDFLKGTGSDFTFNFAGTGAVGFYQLVSWTGSSDFQSGDFLAANLADSADWNFFVEENGLYLEVVPEPSSLALLTLGAGLLYAVRFRRRHRSL